MFVDFDLLPPTARLWVYQANRPFTPGEERQLKAELSAFCDQWATHNKALRTSYSIERNQFLLMAVDDNHMLASGCSIDDSVHRVQEIGRNLGIDFFDRGNFTGYCVDYPDDSRIAQNSYHSARLYRLFGAARNAYRHNPDLAVLEKQGQGPGAQRT